MSENKPQKPKRIYTDAEREKMALAARKQYERRKNDPEFMDTKRRRAREYRERQYQQLFDKKINEEMNKMFSLEYKVEELPKRTTGRPRKYI